MKKLITLICAAFFTGSIPQIVTAQGVDTTGGRYWNENFPTVNVAPNIIYGSSIKLNGSTQTLYMDIYQPAGDTVGKRPLLVIAHGGSFIGGSKSDMDVVEICNRFAKMGYVTASIDYRLGMGFPIDSVTATKAVIRATQDMKAAVRYFRKDAATTNSYKVHPNYIFAGGSSAGAFMSLHLAYLDKLSEVPTWVNISSMGGLDGNSGNPGYSHAVNGVINLCGALGDSSWVEVGDIPSVGLHGTNDQTVPYGTDMIYVSGFPIMVVDGSQSVNFRSVNATVQNPFYTFNGAGHVPYAGTTQQAIAYMDTTALFVKTFLRPILGAASATAIKKVTDDSEIKVYPNPSSGDITISFDNGYKQRSAQLIDIAGRKVAAFEFNQPVYVFHKGDIEPGVYFLKVTFGNNEQYVKKLIFK